MLRTIKRLRAFTSLTFKEPLQENLLFIVNHVAGYISLAVMLTVWRVAYAGRGSVAGLTEAQTLTYVVAQALLAGVLIPNAMLANDLWSGNVATRFLRPVPLFGQYVAETAGRLAFGKLVDAGPLLAVAWLLRVDPRPRGSIALFMLSLALAMTLGYSVEMLVGAAMVMWFEQNAWAADWLRSTMLGALSGAWLPLAFLPGGIGRIVGWLPFASMVSTPLRIYIGDGDAALLAPQLVWTLVCWPLAAWLWRRNRQRVVLYGG